MFVAFKKLTYVWFRYINNFALFITTEIRVLSSFFMFKDIRKHKENGFELRCKVRSISILTKLAKPRVYRVD